MGIDLLAVSGQILMFGLPNDAFLVPLQEIVYKELRIVGTTNAPQVWKRVLRLLEQGIIKVSTMITHQFPFEQLDNALAFSKNPVNESVKVVITL
jgi:threonine dehydrogenase-like Zn-dependent dehydrogenase